MAPRVPIRTSDYAVREIIDEGPLGPRLYVVAGLPLATLIPPKPKEPAK